MHKINWYLTDILLSDASNLLMLMLVSRLFFLSSYHQQTYAIFLVPWTMTGIKVAVCRLVSVNIVVEDTDHLNELVRAIRELSRVATPS